MEYQHILYAEDEKEAIGVLTLNRAEKRNALSRAAEEEITACLQDAARRESLKVLILRAAGDIFCAGHDRSEVLNQPASAIRRLFQTSFNMMYALRTVPSWPSGNPSGMSRLCSEEGNSPVSDISQADKWIRAIPLGRGLLRGFRNRRGHLTRAE